MEHIQPKNNTIIIHSPGADGKSSNRHTFAEHFGCHSIIDGWQPDGQVTPGELHLTNIPLENPPDHVTQMTCVEACKAAGIRQTMSLSYSRLFMASETDKDRKFSADIVK